MEDSQGIDEPNLGDNPFPGADKPDWTERLAKAISARTGMPIEHAWSIAVYVVRPKDYLRRHGTEYVLVDSAISEDDGLVVFTAQMHGFAGTAGEYNERIRTSFDSPLSATADPNYVLPRLITFFTPNGERAPVLTTADPVDMDRQALLFERMETALTEADGERGYRLRDDIAIFGQKETTLHAVFLRQIAEPQDGGTTVRAVPDLTAIKGANRSRARLDLFGLKAYDIVFGINPYRLMGIERDYKTADPTKWVPVFAKLLKEAYSNPDHPGHQRAQEAANVATVEVGVIIGAGSLEGFHARVFDPNRVDHRRPPLDYALSEKAASDLRAVLRMLNTEGLITEADRAWLSGESRDPHETPGEPIVDRRDRRDRALFAIMFPSDDVDRLRLRRTLGEPAPSQTGRRHVDARTRMISAVISDSYIHHWNPRVLDGVMNTSAIKTESFSSTETWRELLTAAEDDLEALKRFVLTRGMHWLAEHKIVEADRGSVGAQTEDPESETRRIRRTQTSIRDALLLAPARTIGLMRELARAANAQERPRQVDIDGVPVDDTEASKAWFDTAFPKTSRRKTGDDTKPTDNPQTPPPTPGQLLLEARIALGEALLKVLPQAHVTTLGLARAAAEAAEKADTTALQEEMTDQLKLYNEALAAMKKDQKTLAAALSVLQQPGADPSDFESASDEFLTRQVDE
ncbi:hypothetical protein CF165_38555 [Amycolatopsis vastitatis]|uniref:Uncharacterized protein n=1 Tax=Amycolatopsis vastitatis TaxID=1905142 RepID=A0A229SRL1_9PSEU|nr:hypothetical protein CF165_38555 [Amycolatopsis vastitatis]